jgi:SpoVK/Ycf46/Vps4 family AAA+-type ATPase
MATALGLDLYRIDLARVVSKYIGETEKNLDRVFAAAADSNAILFFDEADALFGKRSDVKDSHDRYANLEVAYLLQKMEDYDGLAILASNLREHLDDAFLRRLSYIVHFPFPDEGSRLAMWHRVWPREAPRAADLDLGWAARHLRLSGGAIRNVAVTAAYLAAAESGEVTPARLVRAVRRELDKLGADVPPAVVQAEAASARPAALAAGRRS